MLEIINHLDTADAEARAMKRIAIAYVPVVPMSSCDLEFAAMELLP